MMQDISDRVAWLRLAGNVSARRFGRAVGITGKTVRNIEERRKGAGLASIVKICAAFGISVDWLQSGRGRAPTKRTIAKVFEGHG
jgi:transcriptional regulator with XRE-family HTH domain